MKKLVIISAFIMISAGAAFGQSVSVTARQQNQQRRIEQGVRSGELTKGETMRLEREQSKIQGEKKMAKADGKITPREKALLTREQNRASRDIARDKHNSLVR